MRNTNYEGRATGDTQTERLPVLIGVADILRSKLFYQKLGWLKETCGTDDMRNHGDDHPSFSVLLGDLQLLFVSKQAIKPLETMSSSDYLGSILAETGLDYDVSELLLKDPTDLEVDGILSNKKDIGEIIRDVPVAGGKLTGQLGDPNSEKSSVNFKDLEGLTFRIRYESSWKISDREAESGTVQIATPVEEHVLSDELVELKSSLSQVRDENKHIKFELVRLKLRLFKDLETQASTEMRSSEEQRDNLVANLERENGLLKDVLQRMKHAFLCEKQNHAKARQVLESLCHDLQSTQEEVEHLKSRYKS